MDTRLERLKDDTRIEYVAELSGDRHIIEIPLSLIQVDESLKKIRGTQPKSIGLLRDSVRDVSGGDTLYCISLYVPDTDGELMFFIGDGVQRYQALVENGEKKTYAQVVLRWTKLEDAMAAGLSANMARYDMSEQDVFSIMDTNLLTDREIEKLTGYKESTVARIRKVHEVEWMRKLVDKPNEALAYTKAATLVTACGKDRDRLAALKTSISEIEADARKNADYYADLGRTKKLGKKDAKKAKLKFWFDDAKNQIAEIADNLDAGNIEQDDDGVWRVKISAAAAKEAAVVGLANEWNTTAAVSNFFGREWGDMTLSDVKHVKSKLPQIGEYLDAQIARMEMAQAVKEVPMRASTDKFVSDETEPAGSNQPTEQQPTSAVENT